MKNVARPLVLKTVNKVSKVKVIFTFIEFIKNFKIFS